MIRTTSAPTFHPPSQQSTNGISSAFTTNLSSQPSSMAGDTFSASHAGKPTSPRFSGGWMTGLSLLGGAMSIYRDSLNRDLRRSQVSWKKGDSYREYDRYQPRYRKVTIMKAEDGNGRRLRDRDFKKYGHWHYYR